MKRRNPEQQLQIAVAHYLTLVLPSDCFWTAIGHGGGGKIRGAILKMMGVKPGVPDLMLVWRGQAIFIELKTPVGRLSPAQIATHDKLGKSGATVDTCRSIDQVRELLTALGIIGTAKRKAAA